MRARKWSAWLLLLVLLLGAGGAGAESSPLLYQVTDGQGHTLYLLGTIHVGDADLYPLGPAVENAYQAANALAVEMDLVALEKNLARMLRYSSALMLKPDDSAANHLSPETYALGLERLGQPQMVLDRLHPAAWVSLAQQQAFDAVGLSGEWGVDSYLLNRAHGDGKPIEELETLDEQMAVLLAMPDSLTDLDLYQALRYPQDYGASVRLMATAWSQGDEGKLVRLLLQDVAAVPEELTQENAAYQAVIFTNRNDGFERQAKDYLASGQTVLFAVGAGHVVGEDGLAERLAQAGFTVTEIGR